MKRSAALLVVLLLCSLASSVSAQDDRSKKQQGEWKSLIQGDDLDNWEPRTDGDLSTVDIKLVDGEIHIKSTGANVWLSHEKTYEDFELRLEAKMPGEDYNSGIGFRCQGERGKPKGYQCEVDRYKSGMIYAIGSGWVWPDSKKGRKKYKAEAFRIGEWNEYRIRVEGNRMRIWINGKKKTDARDDEFENGFISLQHHGSGKVYRFRRVRVREIHR